MRGEDIRVDINPLYYAILMQTIVTDSR
jgi:hypothetical protein